MIFPAQTSLIPIQVALARFLEQGGSILADYPYWYFGTTPFRYLTGPILPMVLVFFHKILAGFSLFTLLFGLILLSWVMGGAGLYLFLKEMRAERTIVWAVIIFYLFGPIVPFLFRFSDGIYLITFSLLPHVFLFYLKFLRKQTLKWGIFSSLAIAFVILLDSLIIPTLIFGLLTILLANFGWEKIEKRLKQTVIIAGLGVIIATFWYTPFYWLTVLGAPSLAGQGLLGVIFFLGKLLPTAVALGVAFFSIKFFKKSSPMVNFCLYWLLIFGLLTGIRFLSDPDFWLDWTAYGVEIQFGLAILISLLVERWLFSSQRKFPISNFQFPIFLLFAICYSLFAIFIFQKYVLGTFQPDIEQTVEYKISSQISKIARPGQRVFLSGTTAFWLNSLFDIPQVRGGVDQVSVDPNWRELAWQIREGQNLQEALEGLKKRGVDYLVVHSWASSEFYHDFTRPENFEESSQLIKIYDTNGDRIYRLP